MTASARITVPASAMATFSSGNTKGDVEPGGLAGGAADGAREIALVTGGGYQRVKLPKAGGGVRAPEVTPAAAPLTPRSAVEIRTLERRYVTIDGKPVGAPLDDALVGPPPRR